MKYQEIAYTVMLEWSTTSVAGVMVNPERGRTIRCMIIASFILS